MAKYRDVERSQVQMKNRFCKSEALGRQDGMLEDSERERNFTVLGHVSDLFVVVGKTKSISISVYS